MGRTTDAQSLVEVPKLDAESAGPLCERLLAKTKAHKKLAPNLVRAYARLETARGGLVGALAGEMDLEVAAATALDEPPPDRREAAAWGALEGLLSGFLKMPPSRRAAAKIAIAEREHGALFPDGVRFVRLAADKRWTATSSRVAHLKDAGVRADLAALGAAEIVDTVLEEHEATGVAEGFTAPRPAPRVAPGRAAPLDRVRRALRGLILQHAANADDDESGAAAKLAEEMLEPYASFEAPVQKKPAQKAPPAEPPAAQAAPAGGEGEGGAKKS